MKIKSVIIGVMFLLLLVPFISAEYRWANNSDCAETYGEPDSVYDDISLTPTGTSCYGENFNLSGLNTTFIYNVSYIYVFNITDLLDDDIVYAEYCNDVPACSPTIDLIVYNDTNTPVDFLTSYLSINSVLLNNTQLQDLRLQLSYDKIGVGDANSYVDSFGIGVCMEDWIANYTSCNIQNNMTKIYYDDNSCGTFNYLPADNGTIESCDYCSPNWYCVEFDDSCGLGVSSIECLNVTYQDASCCNDTGLPSDCDYLSIGNYSDFDKYCGDIDLTLIVPTYPYVDFNTSYPMILIVTQDNVTFNLSDFDINITEPSGTTETFNLTWDAVDERYEITFIFTQSGDYPFKIFAEYPYDNIPTITGTLIVRVPFYVTFEGFETKNQQTKPYDNDFAYVIAEKTEKMYYDKYLETFIVPIFFNLFYNTSVFSAPYIDGSATLKLWDNETNYAVRIIDGLIDFDGQYSIPEINDDYGTNIYVGKFFWNGSQNESIKVYLGEKDINQYRWLFNWVFIIGLVVIIFTSIILFFVIPEYSQLSIIFGLGFTGMLVLFRIVFFVWKGW